MSFVRGVVFDESVIWIPRTENSPPSLNPALPFLLRLFSHSNIPTGITYEPELSPDKEEIVKNYGKAYSCDCFMRYGSTVNDTLLQISMAWVGGADGAILYVTSNDKCISLKEDHWLIVILDAEAGSALESSRTLYIRKLEELPLTVCRLNKKAAGSSVVSVGYIMKPSRIEGFAKRGAFPLCPTEYGLIFVPLTYDLPLPLQLQEVDVILHKATDDIISVNLGIPAKCSHRVIYTKGMQELQRYIEDHPDLCVVDPLGNIYPVLDRLEIQKILLGLQGLSKEGHSTIRGPHFLKVDNFEDPDLVQRLVEAKLSLPSIVKPQVACGVADAHHMAIIFKVAQFGNLGVPLPAIVQEYVDHSSILYKFYVLGDNVFYAVKKSTPNAEALLKFSANNGLMPLVFDSLKSLPVAENKQHIGADSQHMNLSLVTDAANWLRNALDLTIFGFDVVIEESTGDHVIVDVNYLPSFTEVQDDIAVPAFWAAIKTKYELKRS